MDFARAESIGSFVATEAGDLPELAPAGSGADGRNAQYTPRPTATTANPVTVLPQSGITEPKGHGLLALDRHPNDTTPGDYPVAWAKKFGAGRVFYTSLGHRDDVWDPAAPEGGKRENGPELSKLCQQHVLGGILWALGLAPGDAAPPGAAK